MATCNPQAMPARAAGIQDRSRLSSLFTGDPRPAGRWRAVLRRMFARGVRAAVHRRQRELARMDERMLRDIGLARDATPDLTRVAGRRVPMGLHLLPRQDDSERSD